MAEVIEKLTPKMEGYLETIYELGETGVRLTDIANKMGVSKATANRAVALLREKNLVHGEKYQTVDLTSEGGHMARFICSRHAVLRQFFEEVLGVDARIADTDACIVEHVISGTVVAAMRQYLEAKR